MSRSQGPLPWVRLPEVEFVQLIGESPTSQAWEAIQPSSNRSVVISIFDFSDLEFKDN